MKNNRKSSNVYNYSIRYDNDTLGFSNDTFDQLASFFVQYHDPEHRIKVYLEFAKNDFNGKEQFLTDPMHARAFTIGFKKPHKISESRAFSFSYKHTYLIRSSHAQYRIA